MQTQQNKFHHGHHRTALTPVGAPGPSRNPTGGRASTLAHQQAQQQAAAFAGLPAGTNKYTVLHLLEKIGPDLGWTAQLLRHFNLLIGYTRDQDWKPGTNPVVWLSVEETAYKLNISQSQVRRNESALMRRGAISFKDSGNHHRFGHRDADGNIVEAYGPNLSRAADLIPQLTNLAESLARDRAEWYRTRHALSAARRRVLAAVTCALHERRITDEAGEVLEDRIAVLGARPRRTTALEELRRRLAALEQIEADLAAVMGVTGPQHSPAQAAGRAPQSSDPEGDGRPKPRHNPDHAPRRTDLGGSPQPEQTQELTKVSPHMDGTTPCSARPGKHECLPPLHYKTRDSKFNKLQVATGDRKGSSSSAEGVPAMAEPPNAGEDASGQAVDGLQISFDTLIGLVPPAMRAWLPAKRHVSWHNLVDAAAAHAGTLGISQRAWGEACQTLGRQRAAIALIVIAAKRERQLVHQPGGYLRAMTDRAAVGELHLAPSVYGLINTEPTKERHHV